MKRAERRARTEAVVERRGKHWTNCTGSEFNDYRRGRSRKTHPLDCGIPKCGACHSEKLSGKPPVREQRELQRPRYYDKEEHPLDLEVQADIDAYYDDSWQMFLDLQDDE